MENYFPYQVKEKNMESFNVEEKWNLMESEVQHGVW